MAVKEINFLEVAQMADDFSNGKRDDFHVKVVQVSHYVEPIRNKVKEHILKENDVQAGVDSFCLEDGFMRDIRYCSVTVSRSELYADTDYIKETSDILYNLYFAIE